MTDSSETPGVTEDLCRWIHGLKLEDIPEHIRIRAKHLLLDGISCAVVGAHVPWSEKATQSILAFEPTGQATVFGHEGINFLSLFVMIPPHQGNNLTYVTETGPTCRSSSECHLHTSLRAGRLPRHSTTAFRSYHTASFDRCSGN